MSVAFRRESDEEHKEPRFELPLPPGPNLVTARGLALIQDRVSTIEAALAGATGGEARAEVERDLRYWRTRLATAQVAPIPSGDTVAIGTRVTLLLGDAERVVEIVGHDESDPPAGRLSFAAPLVRALLGAEAGDVVSFKGVAGEIHVVAIEPL